ncbi:hypothetical protein QE152_g10121 [Popillia japonica]|uniref:Uncharacterized protein n=1 Tax=Popillia japonica TaxID=7064 RepID=A0AAW1LXE7_POPJA
MENNQEEKTKRKKGTGTFAQEQKRLKTYLTYKNERMLEKEKPNEVFLSCDRDFVEKRKRVMEAFVPSDLIRVVKSSNGNEPAKVENPFQVMEMNQQDFHNMQTAAHELINIFNLNISKLVALRYESKDPTVVLTKEAYLDSTSNTKKI